MSNADRPANFLKAMDIPQDFEIVRGGFSETDPRVDDDLRGGNSLLLKLCQAASQEAADILDNVVVLRIVLHRRRRSADVHADDTGLCLGTDGGHLGIKRQSGNV